jgi:PhnB protein
MVKARKPVPEGYNTVTPSLTFDDAPAAIEWYRRALGAEELSRAPGPDGKIMHAEIRIGGSRLMLNDAVMGAKSARAYGGSPINLFVYVDDCDALFKRAVAAGATVQMPMGDLFWGDRLGQITDPFGYRWSIASRKEDLTEAEIAQRQDTWLKEFAAPASNT